MAFPVPSDKALHFRFAPWDCCVAVASNPVVGDVVILGTGDRSLGEYDAVATIWGPGDAKQGAIDAGGMGNFLVALLPAANAAMKASLNRHPAFAPTNNLTPPSVDGLNVSMEEYFTVETSPDGNYPILKLKAYSDPPPQS